MADLRQLLDSLLGPENAELLIVIIQDSLFIVLVAVVLRGISSVLELIIGINRFFEIVHEGRYMLRCWRLSAAPSRG